jgi:hypothetical protein
MSRRFLGELVFETNDIAQSNEVSCNTGDREQSKKAESYNFDEMVQLEAWANLISELFLIESG